MTSQHTVRYGSLKQNATKADFRIQQAEAHLSLHPMSLYDHNSLSGFPFSCTM